MLLAAATDVIVASADATESSSDGGIAPLLGGLVILGAILGIGLAAIKRQRAEGRRSKLPPIG